MYFHKPTVIRTVLILLAWLNMWLSSRGLNPVPVLDEETVAYVLGLIATGWGWFKNNYITLRRGKAQRDTLKERGLTDE